MPAFGDQHKSNGTAIGNPFEESKQHISEYTAQEIATLQSRLNKRLGPEFIATRPGPGNQKIAYLPAEKAINLANEVFGFNGWSSSIQNIQIDFVDENPNSGKVSIGLSVVIRITLKDGTYHEDIGYGGIENCKGKAMAFEKSKKEATTDALKRALRNFGNVLGNCMYDKDFITKVSKVKAGPIKFDINDLHRHSDFALKSEEDNKTLVHAQPAGEVIPTLSRNGTEFEDSFDVGDFDDVDFDDHLLSRPDEIIIPAEPQTSAQYDTRQEFGNNMTPSKPPQPKPMGFQVAGRQTASRSTSGLPAQAVLPSNQPRLIQAPNKNQESSSPGGPSQHFTPQQPPLETSAMGRPAGFYSARAAEVVDENNIPKIPANAAAFNPHAESPSIRKTAGVDHRKSVPVKRDTLRPDTAAISKDVVEPKTESGRRPGVPGQTGPGPMARTMSTSAYRPPTRHGSPANTAGTAGAAVGPSATIDRTLTAAKRHPLVDVSNMQHSVTATTGDGADAKRQRVGGPGSNEVNLAPV